MKKIIPFLCLFTFVFSFNVIGQKLISTTKVDSTQLPSKIKYTGSLKSAFRYTDKSGEHFVIISETGEFNSISATDEDARDAEIYAYHYNASKDACYLSWRIYDFIKDCPLDIQANFIKNTFQITDLNNDGVAEIWVMYKLACRGDIGPCDMKIIMYQGKQKYAMRGQNKVKITENEGYGGEYTFDKAFTEGPAIFREFADKLWEKNIWQTWGE